MKPGRELDAQIAEKVMGFQKTDRFDTDVFANGYTSNGVDLFVLPHYSTDISAAWEVVEKIKLLPLGNDGTFKIQWYFDKWICYYDHEDMIDYESHASALTAPHAICLAALKTIGEQNGND